MIWLYIILISNSGREIIRTPHPTYASCLVALAHVKHTPAADDSRTVVMFCGADGIARQYNDTWYKSKVEK
jgi:hypothetical protein